MRLRWWKSRRRSAEDVVDRPEDPEDVVDLRTVDVIDLRDQERAEPAERRAPASPPVLRDSAREEWERSAALVEYPSDLEDWRADRRRDSLKPGQLSAAGLAAHGDAAPD